MNQGISLGSLVVSSWGQMPPGDYDISRMTLFTGETGSGKSTMLDALQAVMTAAHSGIMNFNPGQDEVGQGPRRGKTRRSVESYVVGAEYSKFSRPQGAQGYVGAVFLPPAGSLVQPFTALMAVSAIVDGNGETRQAKLETMSFFILDGVQLSYSDLMVDAEKGISIPAAQIGAHLKRKFPGTIEFHNRKSDYLAVLYGRFRGKKGPVSQEEAKEAAKAWVQSIAYRPIGNVHDLVRDEILEHDSAEQLEHVERIRSLMQQVSQLRKEGEYLTNAVSKLKLLDATLLGVTSKHISGNESKYLALLASISGNSARNDELKARIADAEALIKRLDHECEALEAANESLSSQRTMVEARRLGVPGQLQKQGFEDTIASTQLAIAKSLREVMAALRSASLLEQRAKAVLDEANQMPRAFKGMEATLCAVEEAYKATSASMAGAVLRQIEKFVAKPELDMVELEAIQTDLRDVSWKSYDRLLQALTSNENGMTHAVIKQESPLDDRELELTRTITDLIRQQSTIASGKVVYPRAVEFALTRIRAEYPEANAQVLCDLVEPTSTKWQSAIESYMAGARFSILVEPSWESLVMDFVRQQNLEARVVQGSLCLNRRNRISALPPSSIVNELSTKSNLAEAYLWDQFGTVEKVNSTEELRQTPRGVMMDGKASGSRTMYTLNNRAELVFGKAARVKQAEALAIKISEVEKERSALAEQKGSISRIKFSLNGLKLVELPDIDFAQQVQAISAAEAGLASLDLSKAEELTNESQRLVDAIKGNNSKLKESRANSSKAAHEIESANKQLQGMDERSHSIRESARAVGGKLVEISKLQPTYNAFARMDEMALEAPTRTADVDKLNAHASTESNQAVVELAKAREILTSYNSSVRAEERFVDALPFHVNDGSFENGFKDAIALLHKVDERNCALSGISLLNNTQQLDKAVNSFNDAFTKTFCVDIKNRVEDGIRTLKQLNKVLDKMEFATDKYSLDWSRWEPEMQDYLEFFDAVTALTMNNEEVDLFSVDTLAPKLLAVRDKLVGLLLNEDHEVASKQLMRIADYRNYRRYDIITESKHGGRIRLSEWGTGSGGQLESPAYAVRAAVLANRLKMFDKGVSLMMLASDESFAKMDETRARAVLRFLGEHMGLQVICAMPTTKAGALQDEFDRQYSFTRMGVTGNGELDFMTDVDERIFMREQMKKAWDSQRTTAIDNAKVIFERANPDDEAPVAVQVDSCSLAAS